jgi:tetratricopeptide (TPR) repeat protein
MKFKALAVCVGLLAPAGMAVAMQGKRVEQIRSLSAGYKSQDLQVQNSPFNSTQIASQPDSDGCAVCMEDNSDWSGRNLRGANFWSSSLKGANFSRSDLTGANFSEANLTGANLRGANLKKANLSHADLTGAQLQGANLRDAILFSANLQNANLQGANLTGAVLPAGFTSRNDSTSPTERSSTNAASLETIARETTVLIEGASNGSGVIIARSGNTYYVATAEHVIRKSGQYSLRTHDGEPHQISSSTIKTLPGVDLAVLQFTSNQNYRVARLANSDLLYGVESTPTPIYTAGFPSSKSNQSRRYVFSQGQIVRNMPGDMAAGYSLFYTNATLPGMSGGPILDADGRVVGIHGRGFSEPVVNEDGVELLVRYEVSLGVPINTLLQLASQAGMQLPVQIDSSAPRQGRRLTSEFSTLGSQASNTPIGRVVRLCNEGFDLLLSNQLQASMAAFKEAVQLQPDFYLAWYGAGSVFQAAGKAQNAIDSYNKVLELKPDFYSALLEKGYILHEVGRYSEAIATFNGTINDSEPVEPELHLFFKAHALLRRGQSHLVQKNMQAAIQDYSEAIRVNPNYALAYFQRAAAYLVLNNKPAAVQDYQKAADIYRIQGNMAAYQNARQISSWLQK